MRGLRFARPAAFVAVLAALLSANPASAQAPRAGVELICIDAVVVD